MYRHLLRLAYGLLVLGLGTSPMLAYADPPSSEALVPYLEKVDKLDRLHPPFPFYPERAHTALHPESLSQDEYQAYLNAWKPLWPHIAQLETMFNASEQNPERTISVQHLSARLSTFLLHFHTQFQHVTLAQQQLHSFKQLNAMQANMQDVLFLLKVQGSPQITYRPTFSDMDEEELALNRLLSQIRNNLADLHEFQAHRSYIQSGFWQHEK
jgi:hypothetical protein